MTSLSIGAIASERLGSDKVSYHSNNQIGLESAYLLTVFSMIWVLQITEKLFSIIAEQLNTYELAYLHLLDGLAFGFHELGTPMTLAEFRDVFIGTLMGNCGYSQEQAEVAIKSETADLIAFGRPFISNPDLVERFTNNWPLNPPAEMKDWYSFVPSGYIDFPTDQES
jgi:N-ethylmaleimide reductase